MDPRRWSLLVLILAAVAVGVRGDVTADRNECTDKLLGLATCLTYAQDESKAAAPTPDCCSGLKAVLQASRKCLCVLIKDKDDPNLGLKINVTRAIRLPGICNAPANISDCPRLLNLPPNSKEAQVFEQYGKEVAAQEGGAATAATGGGGASKSGAARAVGPVTLLRWLGVGGARARVLSSSSVFSTAAPLAVPFFLLLLG